SVATAPVAAAVPASVASSEAPGDAGDELTAIVATAAVPIGAGAAEVPVAGSALTRPTASRYSLRICSALPRDTAGSIPPPSPPPPPQPASQPHSSAPAIAGRQRKPRTRPAKSRIGTGNSGRRAGVDRIVRADDRHQES